MKVLFLSLVFSDRKHTNFYEELLEVFVRNGHEVFVACSNDSRSVRGSSYLQQISSFSFQVYKLTS